MNSRADEILFETTASALVIAASVSACALVRREAIGGSRLAPPRHGKGGADAELERIASVEAPSRRGDSR